MTFKVVTLAAGESKTVTIAGLTAPAANSGNLRSFVDAACSTVENNEANNQLATPYVLARPDFVVTNVVITPVSPLVSTAFNVAVTVKNQSNLAGDGGQLRLWLNQPTAQTCAATGGDKNVAIGSLAAGASKTVTFSGLTVASVGTKTLQALADATCVTAESNETNNQLTKTYRVTGTR
jgi:subtilase family serine protease